MTSTMPRAKKDVSIETPAMVEPEVTLSEKQIEEVRHFEEQPTVVKSNKPEKRFGEFKDDEGRVVTVELVEEDAFLWSPGAEKKLPLSDYFFNTTDKPIHDVLPKYRLKSLGSVSMSETMNDLFHEYFKKEDGFVLYKQDGQEVYTVLVPLKFTKISKNNGNVTGDVQVHAISFMLYGSVNFDILKNSLEKIVKNLGYKK